MNGETIDSKILNRWHRNRFSGVSLFDIWHKWHHELPSDLKDQFYYQSEAWREQRTEIAVGKGTQMFSTLTNQADEYVKQTKGEPLVGYQ